MKALYLIAIGLAVGAAADPCTLVKGQDELPFGKVKNLASAVATLERRIARLERCIPIARKLAATRYERPPQVSKTGWMPPGEVLDGYVENYHENYVDYDTEYAQRKKQYEETMADFSYWKKDPEYVQKEAFGVAKSNFEDFEDRIHGQIADIRRMNALDAKEAAQAR